MKTFKFFLLTFLFIALLPVSVAGSKPSIPKLISISVKQSEVSELFEMLSRQNNINIVLAKDVKGEVSINLYDVSVKQAVYAIASAAGLAVERMGKGYLISSQSNVGKTIAGGLTDFRTYKIQYSNASKVSKILEKHLSQYGNIDILQERNLLVIEDLPNFLTRIEKLLYQLDQAPAQILIEAKILSITLDDEQKYGINWNHGNTMLGAESLGVADQFRDLAIGVGAGPAGMAFNYFTKNIEVQLNLLSKKNRVRTLSSPRLLALEHQEAEVIIGDRKGYSVTTTINQVTTQTIQFLESGVILRVTPSIDHFGRVMLDIHPEVSIGSVSTSGDNNSTIPNQTTTEVTTRVLVEDGATVFIGGLIGTTVTNKHQGVPILEDIPLLGALFSSENPIATNTETVVMIKPQIIRHNNFELVTKPFDRIKKFEESRKKETQRIDDFFEGSFIHRSE